MQNVGTAGLRPVPTAGATTPVTLAVSTLLTVPTAVQRLKFASTLVVMISIEATAGTPFARFTPNGVTPTAAVGIQTPAATPTNPVVLWFEGDELIGALRFIQASASLSMTYVFFQKDSRL